MIAGAASVPWSKADPKLREWVAANGAALRWLLMGADQADGIFVPGADHDAGATTPSESTLPGSHSSKADAGSKPAT